MSARRKLTRLYVEDFKKIAFIDMAIGDHVTEIAGKNGAGKSTALHALDALLNRLSAAPAMPIRKGAKRALLQATMGDLIVERTFRPNADGGKALSTITLRTREGAKFPSPQRHLDEIKGAHILDPIKLIQQLLDKPVDVLRLFVDIDFDAIDRANLGDFDRRTEVNRFAKEARAAASLIVVPDNTPDEAVDDSALVDELQRANDQNATTERRQVGRDAHLGKIAQAKTDAQKFRREAADLVAMAERAEQEAIAMQEQYDKADPLPAFIDVTEIRTRIAGAKGINAAVLKRVEKVKHEHIAIKYEQEAKVLTDRMEARKTQKESAIAEANLPIAGVGLVDGVFMLNALPFEQASRGEQLRTAFGFIVASDPEAELRLAWCHDAAVLDDDTLATIDRLAVEMDVQVLLETIRPNSASAIVFEDGHVKGSDGELVKKPPEAAPPATEQDGFTLTAPAGDAPKTTRARRAWTGPGAPTGDQQ